MGNSSSSGTITAADHRQLEGLLQDLHTLLEGRRSPMYANHINRLTLFWRRLKHFIDCVKHWSDADEVVSGCRYLVVRLEAKADTLAKVLSSADWEESSRKQQQPSSFAMMMEELQVRACEFYNSETEIARVVQSMLENFSSLKIRSPLRNLSRWTQFVEMTVGLVCLELPSLSSLAMLARFVSLVPHKFGAELIPIWGNEKVVIEGFLAHIASVVFRAACLCCSPLVRPMHRDSLLTEIADEILFTNPKFLDLTLSFMKALNTTLPRRTSVRQADLVLSFFSSLRIPGPFVHEDSRDMIIYPTSVSQSDSFFFLNFSESTNFIHELRDMVLYLINAPEESINEEHKCDLAEFKLVIFDAILALSPNAKLQFHISSLTVGRRIWLREVGIFLKKLNFKHREECQIEYHVNCLDKLRWNYGIENDILAEEVLGELNLLENLYQDFWDEKIDEYDVRISTSRLLSKVALLRAEPALSKLSNLNETVISHCKKELSFILEYIRLFVSALAIAQVENAGDEEKRSVLIESVCMRALYFCYLFQNKRMEEETIKKTVTGLLNEIQMVNTQIVLRIPKANFPNRSAGMGFLDRPLRNLLELCKRKDDSFLRDHMEKFQMELESLRLYLRGGLQEGFEFSEWKDLDAHVTRFIYELEYVIDSIELEIGSRLQHILWVNNLHRESVFIKTLAAKKLQENRGNHIPSTSSGVTRVGKQETDKLMVRLRDQEEEIIVRLKRGSIHRDLVCIVGMPGLGKTTLAKKVYDDPNVAYHFSCRAWCFVSKSYQKRDLLLKLLGDIQKLTDEILEMDDADLELKLWKSLKGKRYLIVMDDVWDVGAWNALQGSLPDDGKGSRIIITSRLSKLASDAMPNSSPHHLRTLSADESWKLLEMRIFHKEGCCPNELVQAGKEIAVHCKGLALAVVAVAGMLEKTEKNQESWQLILNEMNARILDDPQTQCKSILEMSYNHLPDHLKACFLYLGAFQQDRDVQVKKLIQMWIAEGFIQKTEPKSLEDGGEDSLMDLVDRSLVMVSKRKSKGGVKRCQMHDLLRDLCLSKSKEENFLQLITSHDEPYASFSDSYDGVDLDTDGPSHPAKYESYRVCTYLKRKHFVDSRPSGPSTRSLIFIPSNDANPRRTYDLSFIWENFKFLRVLDLESINLGASFPTTVEVLVLLRYLALSGDLNSIPESISNLWKLETFIVKGLGGKVVLPDTFWSTKSLRHVHVKNQATFNLLGDKFGSSILLDNLVTFSCPSLSYGEDTEKILRKLPNLHKLKCIFLESRDSSGNCNPFPRLGSLMHLESVNILYAGRNRNPGAFNLPLNLKKLTLSRFRLSWSHMSTIGSLPNLEVLKLFSGSLEGLTWDMKDDEFQKLKFLKLDSMNIVRWIASSDHLPELEQLVLWNCGDLEEVPEDFSGLATLQIIEVQRCSESVEKSIRDLQEGMEGLQVFISH